MYNRILSKKYSFTHYVQTRFKLLRGLPERVESVFVDLEATQVHPNRGTRPAHA